jgi:membrane protease YdiL (CAAX protease family)
LPREPLASVRISSIVAIYHNINYIERVKKAFICFLLLVAVALVISFAFSFVSYGGFWVQGGFSIALYVGYLAVFLVLSEKDPVREYNINPRVRPMDAGKMIFLGVVSLCSFLLLQFAFIDLFSRLGLDAGDETVLDGWGQYLMSVFVMAVLPAVIEELLFRGVILKSLKQYGTVMAVLLSSAMFAAFHLNPAQTVYQFILGIMFAAIALRTGNLVLCMLLHFINNFLIITYTFIAGGDTMVYTWNAFTVITAIVLAVLGAVVIATVVKSLRRYNDAYQKQ